MNKKIAKEYIVNACISIFLAVSGLIVTISTFITKAQLNSKKECHSSNEFGAVIESLIWFVNSVANDIVRYIFGYPPLIIGLVSCLISAIAVLSFSHKFTEKTTGYRICMTISYALISLIITAYLLIASAIICNF